MTTLVALLAGIALAGAGLLLVSGLKKVPVTPSRKVRITPAQAWSRFTRRPAGKAGRQRDLRLLAAVAAGLAIFLFTGWLIAIPLVPAVVFLLPILFGRAPSSDIPLLEALDRWVRTLATTLPGGRSVTQTLKASRTNAPPLLADEIGELAQLAGVVARHDNPLAVERMHRLLHHIPQIRGSANSSELPEGSRK